SLLPCYRNVGNFRTQGDKWMAHAIKAWANLSVFRLPTASIAEKVGTCAFLFSTLPQVLDCLSDFNDKA
ncbi:hypothetical protein, partial [Chitinophaga sp.]|uniref:hypothetical protein n=1 Tax=Chitinophaga sp. TaxID=1869181 RepID=UPI002F94D03C